MLKLYEEEILKSLQDQPEDGFEKSKTGLRQEDQTTLLNVAQPAQGIDTQKYFITLLALSQLPSGRKFSPASISLLVGKHSGRALLQ